MVFFVWKWLVDILEVSIFHHIYQSFGGVLKHRNFLFLKAQKLSSGLHVGRGVSLHPPLVHPGEREWFCERCQWQSWLCLVSWWNGGFPKMVGTQQPWVFPLKMMILGSCSYYPTLTSHSCCLCDCFFASKRSLYINIYSNSKLDIVISIIIYIHKYTNQSDELLPGLEWGILSFSAPSVPLVSPHGGSNLTRLFSIRVASDSWFVRVKMFSPHPEKKQPPVVFFWNSWNFWLWQKKKPFRYIFFLGGGETRCRQKKGGRKKRRPSRNFGPPTQQRRSVDLRMEGCPWCLGELEWFTRCPAVRGPTFAAGCHRGRFQVCGWDSRSFLNGEILVVTSQHPGWGVVPRYIYESII